MLFEDLKEMYNQYRKKYGKKAYNYLSQLLEEAKEMHKKDRKKHATKKKNHEQNWQAFKEKNMRKLVHHIIASEVKELGLEAVNEQKIERTRKLPYELGRVKRNLLVDYKEFGMFLPDIDIIIYEPKSLNVICVISSKVTVRERITQTSYWKFKLKEEPATEHIRVYFVTLDENGSLTQKEPAKKERAIAEKDLDGSYVLTEEEIEESKKVKLFERFIEDLRNLLENDEKIKKIL